MAEHRTGSKSTGKLFVFKAFNIGIMYQGGIQMYQFLMSHLQNNTGKYGLTERCGLKNRSGIHPCRSFLKGRGLKDSAAIAFCISNLDKWYPCLTSHPVNFLLFCTYTGTRNQ